MSKIIIFEGAAVNQETREFFLKMAKLAYDDALNVTLTERSSEIPSNMYDNRIREYNPGSLVLVIWREEEIAFVPAPPVKD